MALVMTSGPAGEPVSLAEVKAHLRIDGSAEDILLGGLVLTSRLQIEAALGLALLTQSWRLTIPHWPAGSSVPLPMRPVIAISALHGVDAAGAFTPLSMSGVTFDDGPSPRLRRIFSNWPQPVSAYEAIAIDFTVGFGSTAAAVPAPIRQALILLVAHWYEHRDPYDCPSSNTGIPAAVSDLLLPYRSRRL